MKGFPSFKFRKVTVPYYPYILPTVTYNGKEYTVDTQKREFRNVKYGESPVYVPFDSELGQKLVIQYRKQLKKKHKEMAYIRREEGGYY